MEVEAGKCTNILAAAGRMREIRLLHPEQLVCYAEMKGHTEDITAMIFHQTQSTILFSGDSKVRLNLICSTFSVFEFAVRFGIVCFFICPHYLYLL